MSPTNIIQRKVAVWSVDTSLLALASDLAREGKCTTVPVDALPDLALFFRDNTGNVAGVLVDLRNAAPFNKNPEGVVKGISDLSAENPTTPFVIAVENAAHATRFQETIASQSTPTALSALLIAPSAELSGSVSTAFKIFLDHLTQIDEKQALELGFLEEAGALVDEIEPLILELEQDPANAVALNTIFRNIHTIKGSSGFFDQNPIPEFLHRFEDVLSKMKSGSVSVTQSSVTVMLTALDVTRQMLSAMRAHVAWDGSVAEAVKMFDMPGTPSAASGISDAHATEAQSAAGPTPIATAAEETKVDLKADPKTREAIQVPVQMLDEFMELSGEITVIRNMVNKLVKVIEKETPGNRNVSLLGELLDEMHKINSNVQGRLTELRKVPAGRILKSLPRAVRDLSATLGKEIELTIDGEDLRLDTAVAQVLGESLVHLVRNAIDHGIEGPTERAACGKSRIGKMDVSLHEQGDEILAVIRDDGAGLDPAKIRKKLVSDGKFSEAEVTSFSESRLFPMIFEPGFSTAAKVTGISGRGVGLDMVKSSVEKLRGRIEIESKLKAGTTFTLRLPIPKSVLIVSSLLVQAEGKAFAVPQDRIVRLIRVADAHHQNMVRYMEGGVVLDFHGDLIPVVDLGTILQLRTSMPGLHLETDLASLVIIQAETGVFACYVDAILDSEEIVMKKVGPQLEGRKAFSGATFMGDGTVGLILNVDGIVELSGVHVSHSDSRKPSRTLQTIHKNDILLVDIDVPGDFGVPMDSVYRLEDFEVGIVKNSMDRSIVVYREQVMPLVDLSLILKAGMSGTFIPRPINMQDRERAFVLVFKTRSGQFFGCVVDQIKDFISIQEGLRATNRSYQSIKGSIIIDSRVISVLDPVYLVEVASRAFDQPLRLAGNGQIDESPVDRNVA